MLRYKRTWLPLAALTITVFLLSSHADKNSTRYRAVYDQKIAALKVKQAELATTLQKSKLTRQRDVDAVVQKLEEARAALKAADFWLRYLEPLSYKRINAPLPVEWETEVFEKFEKPYKREGAGLTLARLYLDEDRVEKDSLQELLHHAQFATGAFETDSVTETLDSYHHFFLCNRLFLLNLAAIYTTGFECPDTEKVIPELRLMMESVNEIYLAFNESFPSQALTNGYLTLYQQTLAFVRSQPIDHNSFDHYTFLRNYVNPLFTINQQLIRDYRVVSKSLVDYSLSKNSISIFDKALYHGQNPKGIFIRVRDSAALSQINSLGKMLFFDPILSGNNSRSCASCHKPRQYFTDTLDRTSLQFDHLGRLARNTPSLINVPFNHLLMLDGKHISLQNQTKAVMFEPTEMGSNEVEILKKVMSCKEYNEAFTSLLKYTPQEREVTMDHLVSAITFYYTKFSNAYSAFDDAMNGLGPVDPAVARGFNLFSSKAQCATCHFVPQFNGVKPPYVGSEFEVLGVPQNPDHKKLSPDHGRFGINPATETLHAFRTGTLRNAAFTKPYMHNGVFRTLREVIDFYDGGGGAGRGLEVPNQTLSSDSLHLTNAEKEDLIIFMESLNERVPFEDDPATIPLSDDKDLNNRKVGGLY